MGQTATVGDRRSRIVCPVVWIPDGLFQPRRKQDRLHSSLCHIRRRRVPQRLYDIAVSGVGRRQGFTPCLQEHAGPAEATRSGASAPSRSRVRHVYGPHRDIPLHPPQDDGTATATTVRPGDGNELCASDRHVFLLRDDHQEAGPRQLSLPVVCRIRHPHVCLLYTAQSVAGPDH